MNFFRCGEVDYVEKEVRGPMFFLSNNMKNFCIILTVPCAQNELTVSLKSSTDEKCTFVR